MEQQADSDLGRLLKGVCVVLLLCAAAWGLVRYLHRTAPAEQEIASPLLSSSPASKKVAPKEGEREASVFPPMKFLRAKPRGSKVDRGTPPPPPPSK